MNRSQLAILLVMAALITVATVGFIMNVSSAKPNPYCDKVSDEYMRNGGVCHDRYDVSENGTATCNDGSHRLDPENCPDATEKKECPKALPAPPECARQVLLH